MASIDPFVMDFSGEWYKDPARLHYLNMYLYNIFGAVTGETGESLIEDLNAAEKYPWPLTQTAEETKEFTYQIPQETRQKFNAITKSTSYTMSDFDYVNAKANATITFSQYPCENSVIIVRNGDGSNIKLNGNGKNINGESTGVISRLNTSIEFHYFLDSDEWFAR